MLVITSLWKNKEKHIKNETKNKDSICICPDGSYIRVSNYFKIINKVHAIFIFQKDFKIDDITEQKSFVNGSIQKIEITELKSKSK